MVCWKQLGAEGEEAVNGVGHKTKGQPKIQLRDKGVPEADSLGAQKDNAVSRLK